jgi:hypothetical protein
VGVQGIDAHSEDFDISFREFAFDLRHRAKFRRADWRKIRGVREEHTPTIAKPLMEVYVALGRFAR